MEYIVHPAYVDIESRVVQSWLEAVDNYESTYGSPNPVETYTVSEDWTLTIRYWPEPNSLDMLMVEIEPDRWRPTYREENQNGTSRSS